MITFTSDRGGSHQIYVMDSNGSEQRQLTSGFDRADASVYSPDGAKIAFNGSRDGKETQIYVMNADGSDQTQLTDQPGIHWPDARPSWSPDGAQIAFTAGYVTYVMNAHGSGKHPLTDPGMMVWNVDWSPDGTKFVGKGMAEDPDRVAGMFVIDAAGSERTRLTRGPSHDSPVWSPDGQRIAFTGYLWGAGSAIYVMNADGSGVRNLTDQTARFDPAWSPDGQKFAFHKRTAGENYDIYVMNADGSGEASLTSGQARDLRPNWHPKQHPKPFDPPHPDPGPISPGIG